MPTLCALSELQVVSSKVVRAFEKPSDVPWIDRLLAVVELPEAAPAKEHVSDATWFLRQSKQLIAEVRQGVNDYMPWLLPEFEKAARGRESRPAHEVRRRLPGPTAGVH